MMKTIVTHINLAATLLFALIFSGCALINLTIPYTPDSKRISNKSVFVFGSRFEAETVEGAITLPEAIKIALSRVCRHEIDIRPVLW